MLASKLQGGLMSEYRMKDSAFGHQLRRGQAARLEQPPVELLDSGPHVDLGRPARGGLEPARVGNVVALVAGTPVLHAKFRLLAMQGGDQVEQFHQADGVSQTSPDVEGLPRKRVN